jgi:hypothetical protein
MGSCPKTKQTNKCILHYRNIWHVKKYLIDSLLSGGALKIVVILETWLKTITLLNTGIYLTPDAFI